MIPSIDTYDPQRTGQNAAYGARGQYENPQAKAIRDMQSTIPKADGWREREQQKWEDFDRLNAALPAVTRSPEYMDKYIPGTKNLSRIAAEYNSSLNKHYYQNIADHRQAMLNAFGFARDLEGQRSDEFRNYQQQMGNLANTGAQLSGYARQDEINDAREREKNLQDFQKGMYQNYLEGWKTRNEYLASKGIEPDPLPMGYPYGASTPYAPPTAQAPAAVTPAPRPADSFDDDLNNAFGGSTPQNRTAPLGGFEQPPVASTAVPNAPVDPKAAAIRAALDREIAAKRTDTVRDVIKNFKETGNLEALSTEIATMPAETKAQVQQALLGMARQDIWNSMAYDDKIGQENPSFKPNMESIDLSNLLARGQSPTERTWLENRLLGRFGPNSGVLTGGADPGNLYKLDIGDGRWYVDTSQLSPTTLSILSQYGMLPDEAAEAQRAQTNRVRNYLQHLTGGATGSNLEGDQYSTDFTGEQLKKAFQTPSQRAFSEAQELLKAYGII